MNFYLLIIMGLFIAGTFLVLCFISALIGADLWSKDCCEVCGGHFYITKNQDRKGNFIWRCNCREV